MSYNPKSFEIDEVVQLKGHYFKVCLIDAFTRKLGLKYISEKEAQSLETLQGPK